MMRMMMMRRMRMSTLGGHRYMSVVVGICRTLAAAVKSGVRLLGLMMNTSAPYS
jgi:hypothetical protein